MVFQFFTLKTKILHPAGRVLKWCLMNSSSEHLSCNIYFVKAALSKRGKNKLKKLSPYSTNLELLKGATVTFSLQGIKYFLLMSFELQLRGRWLWWKTKYKSQNITLASQAGKDSPFKTSETKLYQDSLSVVIVRFKVSFPTHTVYYLSLNTPAPLPLFIFFCPNHESWPRRVWGIPKAESLKWRHRLSSGCDDVILLQVLDIRGRTNLSCAPDEHASRINGWDSMKWMRSPVCSHLAIAVNTSGGRCSSDRVAEFASNFSMLEYGYKLLRHDSPHKIRWRHKGDSPCGIPHHCELDLRQMFWGHNVISYFATGKHIQK